MVDNKHALAEWILEEVFDTFDGEVDEMAFIEACESVLDNYVIIKGEILE